MLARSDKIKPGVENLEGTASAGHVNGTMAHGLIILTESTVEESNTSNIPLPTSPPAPFFGIR